MVALGRLLQRFFNQAARDVVFYAHAQAADLRHRIQARHGGERIHARIADTMRYRADLRDFSKASEGEIGDPGGHRSVLHRTQRPDEALLVVRFVVGDLEVRSHTRHRTQRQPARSRLQEFGAADAFDALHRFLFPLR